MTTSADTREKVQPVALAHICSVRFNVNRHVRVRLTEYGRHALRRNHDLLYGEHAAKLPYAPPTEDADGWSRWQLWCLMQELGPAVRMGLGAPFETGIVIELAERSPAQQTASDKSSGAEQ